MGVSLRMLVTGMQTGCSMLYARDRQQFSNCPAWHAAGVPCQPEHGCVLCSICGQHGRHAVRCHGDAQLCAQHHLLRCPGTPLMPVQ